MRRQQTVFHATYSRRRVDLFYRKIIMKFSKPIFFSYGDARCTLEEKEGERDREGGYG